jgi:hypothetical protein
LVSRSGCVEISEHPDAVIVVSVVNTMVAIEPRVRRERLDNAGRATLPRGTPTNSLMSHAGDSCEGPPPRVRCSCGGRPSMAASFAWICREPALAANDEPMARKADRRLRRGSTAGGRRAGCILVSR